jgi:Domain of unknown function (DUF397)
MNAAWAKSSLSFSNGNCVEVTELPGGSVGVRNSRDPRGPVLRFTREEWDAFLGGARLGEFDRFGTTASRRGRGPLTAPSAAPAQASSAALAVDLRPGDTSGCAVPGA